MQRSIGVLATDHIAVGLVEEHHIVGPVLVYPERGDEKDHDQATVALA
jgi:hypothetical protein